MPKIFFISSVINHTSRLHYTHLLHARRRVTSLNHLIFDILPEEELRLRYIPYEDDFLAICMNLFILGTLKLQTYLEQIILCKNVGKF